MSEGYQRKYSKPHKEDCFAIKEVEEGEWSTPWTISDIKTEWLKEELAIKFADGTIEEQIAVIRCNDPDCPAKVAIPARKIEQLLPNRVEQK